MEDSSCVNSLADNLVYLTLSQATSQDANILKPAEQKLSEWETHPGFYTSLCKVIVSKDIEISVRWLATVCMKNGIDRYYRKNAPNGISEHEKSIIRQELLKCFDEPTDVIALQLAVLVAKIARIDWPREWPELIETLVNNIKSNENEIKRYRSLLILSHVVKTLSTKRLIGDKKLFQELTANIFPIMFEFWNYSVDAFLSADLHHKKSIKYKCDLEMSLLSAKILSKLTVEGFNKPHLSSQAMNFMAVIFERTKTLLQFRLTINDLDERCRKIIEKHAQALLKVLSSVLERHPFSYVDFIQITLQYSFFYCFTKEGHELMFDSILIRWLNLMKAILLCQEYKLTRSSPVDADGQVTKVTNAKNSFFTSAIAHEICLKLIDEYFVLTDRDLAFWDSDPEAYAAEEIGESWKYNLRPCIEGLFIALLSTYKETLIPILVNVIESNKASPNPDDMAAILKKDAVYNVFGLSVFDLFDEIDFDKWFSEILIPELHVKNPNYRILRRRIAWLIGRWTGLKLSTELRPLLYNEIISLLEPTEDIAVRLAVANTIKDVIDDFEFRTKAFLEHIPRCFQLLYTLLEQSKECDTKMQVLTVLSFIIERVGWEIAPFFDSLVNYLPLLWQHSDSHNMLRCAIVTVLTQIVRGLGDQCVSLEKFVIPVIEYSLDMKQDGHVYLLEDGLHLFIAYVENINSSEDIFSVFHYLPPLLEKSTENIKIIVNIITALLLLSPDTFMQTHAHHAVQTFMDLVPDMKSEGVALILEFFEICIKVRPYHSMELLQSFLRDSLVNMNVSEDKPLVVSLRLSILARIILLSNEIFAQLVENISCNHNTSRDIMFTAFLDSWLHKMNIVWPPERRKLLGLALMNLLTAGSSIVLTRFNVIISMAIEVLNDILVNDDGVFTDSLLFNDDGTNSVSSDAEDQEQKTEHEIRLSELTLNDPIHKVDLCWYFQNQLEELQKQIGDGNFQHLMGTVTEETINQIKLYIKKA